MLWIGGKIGLGGEREPLLRLWPGHIEKVVTPPSMKIWIWMPDSGKVKSILKYGGNILSKAEIEDFERFWKTIGK